MSNWLYELGLLVLVFGGFLATNSTGLFADVGMLAVVVGLLAGLVGVAAGGPPRSQ
ncbi:hypothetical protein [Halobaculum sp. P14]|uniref:hypothetical protein n=1 Tax=Halobaculum sp. P14 TaxID=3421638 RepID=UPI003EB6D908